MEIPVVQDESAILPQNRFIYMRPSDEILNENSKGLDDLMTNLFGRPEEQHSSKEIHMTSKMRRTMKRKLKRRGIAAEWKKR